MTTAWQTETEEPTQPFTQEDWDAMSITERAARAKLSGREGKLGSKLWAELTPDEQASIIYPEKRPVKLDYQIKAHVALEDSNKEKWGMVKYLAPGDQSLEAVDGELVGNWSISPADGLVHVFLETPLTALADRATQEFARYSEMRREAAVAPKASKTRAARTPKSVPVQEPNEDLLKISDLRKKLGR